MKCIFVEVIRFSDYDYIHLFEIVGELKIIIMIMSIIGVIDN